MKFGKEAIEYFNTYFTNEYTLASKNKDFGTYPYDHPFLRFLSNHIYCVTINKIKTKYIVSVGAKPHFESRIAATSQKLLISYRSTDGPCSVDDYYYD